jgi:hypothetical protein
LEEVTEVAVAHVHNLIFKHHLREPLRAIFMPQIDILGTSLERRPASNVSVSVRKAATTASGVAATAGHDGLRAIMSDFPNTTVVIEGHCDERGSAEYNLGLGHRRSRQEQGSPTRLLMQIALAGEKGLDFKGLEDAMCRAFPRRESE